MQLVWILNHRAAMPDFFFVDWSCHLSTSTSACQKYTFPSPCHPLADVFINCLLPNVHFLGCYKEMLKVYIAFHWLLRINRHFWCTEYLEDQWRKCFGVNIFGSCDWQLTSRGVFLQHSDTQTSLSAALSIWTATFYWAFWYLFEN